MNTGNQFQRFPKAPSRSGGWIDFESDADLALFSTVTANGAAISVADTERHGAAKILCGNTTDDSLGEIQLTSASIQCEVSKEIKLLYRLKASDMTQSDLYAGAFGLDGSIVASLPNDGIFVYSADGSDDLNIVVRGGGITALAMNGAIATLVDDTWYELGLLVQMTAAAGVGRLSVYSSGDLIGGSNFTGGPTGMMAPAFCYQSGNAIGQKSALLDYVGWDQQR